MSHPRRSLTTLSALAVAVGLAACGGGAKQTQATAPPASASGQPMPGGEQYGAAMGQPGAAPGPGEMPATPGAQPPGAMPGPAPTETSPYGAAPGAMGGAPGGPSPGATTGPGTMGPPPSGMTPPTGAEPSAPGGAMTGEPSMTPQQGAPGMTGAAMDVSSLDDGQLAAVLQSINTGEMQSAQLAVAQGSSPEVKRFAKEMLTQHRQMQSRTSSMLSRMQMTPSENAVSNQVKNDAQSEMSMLQGERGKDFDRDYIDAQVRDHNHALELVDRMISSAKNPELKTALQNMRTKVETHLSEAERIQSSLQKGQTSKQRKNPAGSTGPSTNPSTNPY